MSHPWPKILLFDVLLGTKPARMQRWPHLQRPRLWILAEENRGKPFWWPRFNLSLGFVGFNLVQVTSVVCGVR